MRCFSAKKLMMAHTAGALSEQQSSELLRHAACCTRCREELDMLEETSGLFKASKTPAMEPAPDLWDRIRLQIESEAPVQTSPAPPAGRPRVWVFGPALVSAAAAVVLAAVFTNHPETVVPDTGENPAATRSIKSQGPSIELGKPAESQPGAVASKVKKTDANLETKTSAIIRHASARKRPTKILVIARAPAAEIADALTARRLHIQYAKPRETAASPLYPDKQASIPRSASMTSGLFEDSPLASRKAINSAMETRMHPSVMGIGTIGGSHKQSELPAIAAGAELSEADGSSGLNGDPNLPPGPPIDAAERASAVEMVYTTSDDKMLAMFSY